MEEKFCVRYRLYRKGKKIFDRCYEEGLEIRKAERIVMIAVPTCSGRCFSTRYGGTVREGAWRKNLNGSVVFVYIATNNGEVSDNVKECFQIACEASRNKIG